PGASFCIALVERNLASGAGLWPAALHSCERSTQVSESQQKADFRPSPSLHLPLSGMDEYGLAQRSTSLQPWKSWVARPAASSSRSPCSISLALMRSSLVGPRK